MSEQEEDFEFLLNNLGIYDGGDEGTDPPQNNDKRTIVNRPYEKHPYKGIGRVTSYFARSSRPSREPSYGTASILNYRLVVTSAHNIYDKKTKQLAESVYFYP
jgi:V8-like Glu-specific endopeptidase